VEKERPEPRPRPEPDRDDVRVAVNRCPFCHEDVAAGDATAVVCRACLARHHGGCWSEGGRCGACGGKDALVTVVPATRTRRVVGVAAMVVVALLAAVGLLVVVGAGFAAWTLSKRRDAMEQTRRDAGEQIDVPVRTPASFAELQRDPRAPTVPDGITVLVTDVGGTAYGALVFDRQSMTPESGTFRWWFRRSGKGTFDPQDPEVTTGSAETVGSGGSIQARFGSFRIPWSGGGEGTGYVYADTGLRFHLTTDPPESIDPDDPARIYLDADGRPWKGGR
jgi:hypothetical protein